MALDVMARGIDRLHEINMEILKSHLTYLHTDDSPSKIVERHKLEGIIHEYLCLVPNESKYVFPETAHILHRSAATLNDFSAYRASEAWSAISMYASNLLAQPWRKEYRTLRTYSGYYKHEIEANLIGAELMFEQMGYKHNGLQILTLEGPIDPDIVSSVSRDAIVAFVECEILKQIWESVSKTFTISWLEVLEFRENYVGTPEHAIRALNHRFLERLHQNRAKAENYRDFHHGQMCLMDTVPPTTAPFHINANNFNTGMPIKSNFGYTIESDRILPPYGFYPVATIPMHSNRYHPDMHPDIQQYQPRVSTERLIEFDAPNHDRYEKVPSHYRKTIPKDLDQVDFSKRNFQYEEDYSKVERKPIKTSTSLDSATNENWDYVYQTLGDIGYSKDIGEREDFLRKKDKNKEKHRAIINDHDDKYLPKNLVPDKRKSPEFNRDKFTMTNGKDFRKRYNNLSLDLTDLSSSNPSSEDRMKKSNQPKNYQKISDSVKSLSIGTKVEKKKTEEEKWNCPHCTYLNKLEEKICEMCGKSKSKGVEDKPLESGSKQCPNCTLINEKNASKCEACGTSLQNSATYV